MPLPTKGLQRIGLELFYTKQSVADECIENISRIYNLDSFDSIIEPSAGTGVFLNSLERIGVTSDTVIAYDIEPKDDRILKDDYLQSGIEDHILENHKILVVGNPPFGRQSSLAKRFIKYSCKFASVTLVIAFILPRSFKKSSMLNAFSLNFHKVYERDLEPKSFIHELKEHSVPCIFQIWEKRDYNRIIPEKLTENESYKIVPFPKSNIGILPDIAFRRVGINAGKFYWNGLNGLSEESHYFIKFTDTNKEYLQEKLNNIRWETNNTIGPKSISKQELIKELNLILK